MKTTKVNLGFAPSKNYNKVNIELLDHEIDFEDDISFMKETRRLFKLIRDEARHQFDKWEQEEKFEQETKAQKSG